MNIPAKLVSGDSVTWKDAATVDSLRNSIAAPDWVLKYAIRGDAAVLDLTSTADGNGWTTTLSAAQSILFAAGFYYWQAFAEKGSERVTLGQGRLEVTPNLVSQAAGVDNRTQSRKDLDAVQVAMRAMIAGGAVQKYAIGNRQIEKMTLHDLISLESRLKAQVIRDEKAQIIANGLGNPHKMSVRFK